MIERAIEIQSNNASFSLAKATSEYNIVKAWIGEKIEHNINIKTGENKIYTIIIEAFMFFCLC